MEEHKPSMEQDKDCKGNTISDLGKSEIIVFPHVVCQVELQDVSCRMQTPLFVVDTVKDKKLDIEVYVKAF